MNGRARNDNEQECGTGGVVETKVAPGDHDRVGWSWESLEALVSQAVRRELGATQTSRQAKAEARRRVRKGGRRGRR